MQATPLRAALALSAALVIAAPAQAQKITDEEAAAIATAALMKA